MRRSRSSAGTLRSSWMPPKTHVPFWLIPGRYRTRSSNTVVCPSSCAANIITPFLFFHSIFIFENAWYVSHFKHNTPNNKMFPKFAVEQKKNQFLSKYLKSCLSLLEICYLHLHRFTFVPAASSHSTASIGKVSFIRIWYYQIWCTRNTTGMSNLKLEA